MNKKPQFLAPELQELVSWSVSVLGEVIADAEGADFFRQIESLRRYLKNFRGSGSKMQKHLDRIQKKFEKKDSAELNRIAHAFSLMLELINACENAYRSHRIENHLNQFEMPPVQHQQMISWVLTAHPTEARNPLILSIFENVFKTLQAALRGSNRLEYQKLKAYLKLAWGTTLARPKNPTPIDEGQTLFTVLLRDHIVDTFLKMKSIGYNFTFRTWVGGDKDGHPFVDEKVLVQSLTLSRKLIIEFLEKYLGSSFSKRPLLTQLKKLSSSDTSLILKLKAAISKQRNLPEAELALQIFEIFPNLLIPVEMREEASVIDACLAEPSEKKRMNFAIFRMLMTLKKLAGKQPVSLYSRGLVISMVANAQDVENTFDLVCEVFGKPSLKVVPLFENRAALEASGEIVSEFLESGSRRRAIKKYWASQFEVMVGYSDSSKEMGVLKSRLLVRRCIQKLVPLIKNQGLIPVLFHGSGGSITRGGGSFRDQSSWWPKEAFTYYKATIQGEMVQRTFASAPITTQNLSHIIEEQNSHAQNKNPTSLSKSESRLLENFSDHVSAEYQILVSDPEFLRFVEKATIYSYLKNLTIGSRPSKRRQLNSVSDLRAIPWVLTWTQSRLLMPEWWGLGSAFKAMSLTEQKKLKIVFAKDPLCLSFIKQVGFSLAKVEEAIFSQYILRAKDLSVAEKKMWIAKISQEFHRSVKAVQFLTSQKELTWFKPWLGESVRYRSPLIHPLNLIQLIGIHRHNALLIRETTTGIACGMMTTG